VHERPAFLFAEDTCRCMRDIDFTDAISAKIEYLYVNLGTVSCPADTLCSSDNGEPTNLAKTIPSGSVSFTENLIRAGINYKFSW
jgi:opacity protein-like surface antigen